ncbi:MAG: hypothetical protein C5B60_09450 [Chloroflexi bacterium]|nr:MAG: hypothetical protein C5B60_09450 [Chloroflexota bacterium]
MSKVKGPHTAGSNIIVNSWERLAVWQPQSQKSHDKTSDLQATPCSSVTSSGANDECEQCKAILRRIRQSQINACFAGIFAVLGISLAVANATPNQEIAEVATLAVLLIVLLIPFACNRAGAVTIASIILTLLPTVALVATFIQPLPSGQSALTWTYDAGLAFAGLGALIATLAFRPRIAWCLIVMGIILPLSLLVAVMPHAPSLVGLDVADGIIPSYWSSQHQELYALYDFVFRPFLLAALLGLIGMWMRRFVFE